MSKNLQYFYAPLTPWAPQTPQPKCQARALLYQYPPYHFSIYSPLNSLLCACMNKFIHFRSRASLTICNSNGTVRRDFFNWLFISRRFAGSYKSFSEYMPCIYISSCRSSISLGSYSSFSGFLHKTEYTIAKHKI